MCTTRCSTGTGTDHNMQNCLALARSHGQTFKVSWVVIGCSGNWLQLFQELNERERERVRECKRRQGENKNKAPETQNHELDKQTSNKSIQIQSWILSRWGKNNYLCLPQSTILPHVRQPESVIITSRIALTKADSNFLWWLPLPSVRLWRSRPSRR